MANDERPIFIFIPGAWHMPEAFDTIRELMSKRELDSEAVALPSVGAEPPIKGLNDDISHVRSAIARLADQGRQIVLVVHSYGGMVGPGAVQGLEYAQRAQSGQKGGVIMFVYMAAFVAPKGNSLYDMLGRQWLPWMKLNGDYCYSSSEETAFYSDLPPDEQKKWKSKLKHISVRAFLEPAMHEPWHNLSCMYILCEKDQGLPIAL